MRCSFKTLAIGFSLLFGGALAQAEPLRFTILHTNDLHSHCESFREKGHEQGGMTRLVTLLRQLRTPQSIVVDGGDIFQGSLFYQTYHGEIEVEVLNRAGFDLGTIGNHEFDDGPANLALQLSKARYQLINCNLDSSAQPELGKCFKPWAVRELSGQKVGFVGAMTPDLESLANHLEGVKIQRVNGDWIVPVRQAVAELTAQGIDKIIMVTHCGVNYDREIAEKIPEVDIIIGAHSHTRLDQPIDISHADGSHCLIVQTGCYCRTLGQFDLAFDGQGRVEVSNTRYKVHDLSEEVPEDPELKAYLASKSGPFEAAREDLHSVATVTFEAEWGLTDSPLGDLITDAFAAYGRQHGAPIALHNRGGIRANLEAGPVRKDLVEAVLPFDNKLCLADVRGEKLRKVLQQSLQGERLNHYLEIHGLRYGYNPNTHRLLFVEAQDMSGRWRALQDKAEYRVAVNDYNLGGAEGFDFGKPRRIENTGKRLSEFLISFVRSHPRISPPPGGRIVPLVLQARLEQGFLRLDGVPKGARVNFYQGKGEGLERAQNGSILPLIAARPLRLSPQADGRYALPPGVQWVSAEATQDQQRWLSNPVRVR
ncbi:MAG: bifunctional UDP-sugar hydrolase/5'-nucleotidase [Vulcanimicrobiota bacterium]